MRAGGLCIDQDAGEPVVGGAVGRLGHETDARDVREMLLVLLANALAAGDALVECFELSAPNGGQKITEPVVVSDFLVLVVGYGLSSLGR